MRLTTVFTQILPAARLGGAAVRSVALVPESAGRAARIAIDVGPAEPKRLPCGGCGKRSRRFHGTEPKARTWRGLSLGGVPVELRGLVRRVRCSRCGVRTTRVGWAGPGSTFTRQFEDEVAWFLQRASQAATAAYFRLSWVTVGKIARRVVDEYLIEREEGLLDTLAFIGVDEICYGHPKKFLTVVVDQVAGRVVWAAEGKAGKTLQAFFTLLGPERCAQIEVVTMDMSSAYIRAVRDTLPHATIVFDRFHVVRLVLDAVDEVRRAAMREVDDAATKGAVKGTRFPLLKNPWNLTPADEAKLATLQQTNHALFRAYLLKESFQAIYESTTEAEADTKFRAWYGWARRSRLPAMVGVAATIRKYWDGIRSFIVLRLSNGIVEGFNSKIRMISHRAFGFHSAQALIAMIMLLCTGITIIPTGH